MGYAPSFPWATMNLLNLNKAKIILKDDNINYKKARVLPPPGPLSLRFSAVVKVWLSTGEGNVVSVVPPAWTQLSNCHRLQGHRSHYTAHSLYSVIV